MWLSKALKHVCSGLATGSTTSPTAQLHLVSFPPPHAPLPLTDPQPTFTTLPVSPEVADSPANWPALSTHIRGSNAQGLVLVRPLPAAQEALLCSVSGLACAHQPQAACASLAGLAGVEGTLEDDCCSREGPAQTQHDGSSSAGAGASASASDARRATPGASPQHTAPSEAPGHAAPPAAGAAAITRHHGVVVQGASPSSADGCYVLKTTQSYAHDQCTCVHYSLTHVCHGAPLAQQLREAWLV